jgi:hypothetical protein
MLLAGVRVLDLSRVLAGPLCTMMLGDLGADVLKVERPGGGDETRAWGPPFDARGESAYYLSVNRNKLGLAADLDADADRALLRDLVAGADVVVDNFRPGTLERRGLDPAALLAAHPALVWCTITGFGPDVARPGYDFVVQAERGWMAINGEPTACRCARASPSSTWSPARTRRSPSSAPSSGVAARGPRSPPASGGCGCRSPAARRRRSSTWPRTPSSPGARPGGGGTPTRTSPPTSCSTLPTARSWSPSATTRSGGPVPPPSPSATPRPIPASPPTPRASPTARRSSRSSPPGCASAPPPSGSPARTPPACRPAW